MKKVSPFSRFITDDVQGLTVRQNPRNGFTIIELDYWADPIKRDPEWIDRERRRMPPKQWAVEMERSWETYAGRPIYEDAYNKQLHRLAAPMPASPDYPIFRGWDFGGNQSCAIAQLQGSRLIILDELPNGGLNTRKFAPEVISYCNQQFGPEFHYIDIVDPSAFWEGKTAEGKACTDVMRELGIQPVPASTNDPQKRIDSVMRRLMSLVDGKPSLQLNPHCEMLLKGFEGGYHYPEKPTQSRRADRPVKNLYSHIHDALQYICLRLDLHKERNVSEEVRYEDGLANPSYRFTNRKSR